QPDLRVYRHPLEAADRLKRPGRSCRRWQLLVCNSGFTSSATNSACPSSFVTVVESCSAPKPLVLVLLDESDAILRERFPDVQRRRSAVGFAYQSLLLAIPVPVLLAGALVVVLLALDQGNLALDQMFFPVERQGDAAVALPRGPGVYLFQLLGGQQQLAGAGRVGDDVGAGGLQGGDVGAEQVGFAILEQDVAVHQLCLAGAQALHFPAGQGDARLEA